MNTNRQYVSVSELLQDIAPDREFQAEFEEHVQRRKVIKHLLALRAAKGLAQHDLAEKLGCTQSRISKLENGTDDELRLGDLLRYTGALGLSCGIMLSPRRSTVVEQIKYHAFCIKDRLEHLVNLAGDDQAMTSGAARFLLETVVNVIKMVADSAEKLPKNPETQSPYIRIETYGPDMGGQIAGDEPASIQDRKATA